MATDPEQTMSSLSVASRQAGPASRASYSDCHQHKQRDPNEQ